MLPIENPEPLDFMQLVRVRRELGVPCSKLSFRRFSPLYSDACEKSSQLLLKEKFCQESTCTLDASLTP